MKRDYVFYYFPIVEVSIFILVEILIGLFFWSRINIVYALIIGVAGYFFLLGEANFISIKDNKLLIIYFNPLLLWRRINISSIVKVDSGIEHRREFSASGGSMYHTFKVKYDVEFMEGNRRRKFRPSVINRKKEDELLKLLTHNG